MPNSEPEYLQVDGRIAEHRASNRTRERDDLSLEVGEATDPLLPPPRAALLPDLFVVGGGISKRSADFLPLLDLDTEIVPATLLNRAGVGAAARLEGR